jgi:hypothetical protein
MSVTYTAEGCSQLQFLGVSSCPSMTEDIINALSSLRMDSQEFQCLSIPTLLPNVSRISVKHCTQLGHIDLKELKSRFCKVKVTSLDK